MPAGLENLKESNEFLNLLLDNMDSAVLVADENLKIHQFNKSFLDLFDNAADSIMEAGFGQVAGCVNAVLENKACGETSQCANCLLRRSLVLDLTEQPPVGRQPLNRVFYINGKPVQKYLQFSTRRITFRGRKMFLVIIYDVTELEKQKIELQKKQKLLDRDLEAAAAIQKSLLPARSPVLENMRVAWKFEPCAKIGGDIFNIQPMDEHKVGLYMLDVCGHGVPAALISVAVSQFLNSGDGLLGSNCELVSPEIVLQKLYRAFPYERFDSFFSIICMTIDTARGLLTYSNGGHPPPVLLRSDGGLQILDRHGPAVGLDDEQSAGQHTLKLKQGDKILLYTDGLLENCNPQGVFFGKQRFYELLKQYRQQPIDRLVASIYSRALEFRRQAKADDDISLLGVEYCGQNGNHYSI